MRLNTVTIVPSMSFLVLPMIAIADPLECNIFFDWDEETENNNWDTKENWGPNHDRVPDENDNVCITGASAEDFEVIILKQSQSYEAKAKAIWIDETALLEIYGDESLILYGENLTSTIDGVFKICPPFDGQVASAGRLILADNHTVAKSANSGLRAIHLLHATAAIEAASGSGAILTVSSGFTVAGTGNIKLPVVNNGIIIANRPEYDLPINGDLYLYDSVTLNGLLKVDSHGTAFLTANQVVPSGGIIELERSGSNIGKLKPRPSYSPTLTVNSGGIIKGAGELHIKPVNNGTVAARDGILELKQGGEGSGKWTSETSTGNLLVSAEVKGSGTWELDDHASAKIQIAAACECLTGNVTIYAGTLDVDANFRTTQQLSLTNESTLIDVASNMSARFSVSTLPGCVGGGGGD